MLQLGAGHEADFYALLQRRGDAAQHFQGVAIVVRIFEPGNNGLGRADLPRKLGLRELGLRAQFANLSCDVQIGFRNCYAPRSRVDNYRMFAIE